MVRWGLIGAGWIATKAIAPAMHAADNAIVQAVASRDPIRAQKLNPITVHQSYEALINDAAVDAVYISLPNHLHHEWTIKALKAGKHVLCEKPFAMNADEVREMIKVAIENNRTLVEAVSSMWHPRMAWLVEYVAAGKLGEITSIDSAFTFPASIAGNYRLSPEMGGGALFDVGVYSLHAMAALIGTNKGPMIESCEASVGPTGIDLTTKWKMKFSNSTVASGVASFEMPERQSLVVNGSLETAELVGDQAFTSWHSPSTLRIGAELKEFAAVDPYQIMIENFGKQINGEESWVLPLETSLMVQEMLDQLLEAI